MSRRSATAWLIALFVLSRAAAALCGVRFIDDFLPSFWHFADSELLRRSPWETLRDLHAQPPLYNAYLAAGIALGAAKTAFFQATSLLFGAGTMALTYSLARRAGAKRGAALAATAFVSLSPSALLYENLLLYEMPCVFLAVAAFWSLERALRKERIRDWAACFGFAALLVLTRSLFHPLVLLLGAGGLIFFVRAEGRRAFARGAALPLLIVALLLGGRAARFGVFSFSSWMGMNLARMTPSRIRPFSALEAYAGLYDPEAAPGGSEILTAPRKHDGSLNLHHGAYVSISKMHLKEARSAILQHPGAYLRNVWRAYKMFLTPSSHYGPLKANRPALRAYERAWDWIFGPGFYFIVLPALLGWSAVAAQKNETDPRVRLLLMMLVGFALYVTGVSSAMEIGENGRFRFVIEAALAVLAARAGSKINVLR